MSYKIVYAKKREKKHYLRRLLLTVAFFLLFVFSAQKSWAEGAARLQSLLIPEAMEAFVQQIQCGESFTEAVDAFCQELIYGE